MRKGRPTPTKMKSSSRLRDQGGQSTIEFALTMILLLSILLFYIQLSFVFAYGNFVHYATFMAARAFLAAGPTKADQTARAKKVLVQMLKKSEGETGVDKFPSIAKGVGGDPSGMEIGGLDGFTDGDRDSSWMLGVRYTFRSKLFLIPFGAAQQGPQGSAANTLTLSSESWLGSDPSYADCQNNMGSFNGIFDNGC